MDCFIKNQGFHHLADEIFSFLEPKDLASCALVSDSWNWYLCTHKKFEFLVELYNMKVEVIQLELQFFSNQWILIIDYVMNCRQDLALFSSVVRQYLIEMPMETPLHWAVSKNNLEFIQILPWPLLDLDERDQNFDTAFHKACRSGNKEAVQIFLNNAPDFPNGHHPNFLNFPDGDGYAAIHIVCQSDNNVDILRLLLDHAQIKGIQVNAEEEFGNGLTTLEIANENGSAECFNILSSYLIEHDIAFQLEDF